MIRSAFVLALVIAAAPALCQEQTWSTSTYGLPGLIDMPGAIPAADGELAFTSSHFVDQTRHTLTFQISPRLTGAFRYALLYGVSPNADGATVDFRFDRSFSLQYLLSPETDQFPALAIGLNDFLGTGLYSSEYIVATRTVSPQLRVTAGLGWGRLAGVGSFDNPLGALGSDWDTRPVRNDDGLGGQVQWERWFHGPAALFAGVEWRPTDRLTLVAEYSSDAYPNESPYVFDRRSPINLGLRYDVTDRLTLGAQYLYGSEVGLQLTYALDPSEPRYPSGLEGAPPLVRAADSLAAASWTAGPQSESRAVQALEAEGITLHGLNVTGSTARIEIENRTYPAAAQAVGRTARALTGILPPGVTRFDIVLIERGLPVTEVRITRADLEELEFAQDGAWAMQARSPLGDPGPGVMPLGDLYPRLDWSVDPYLAPALFDPDAPIRADVGLDFGLSYEPAPGFIFSALVRQPLAGNLDESTRASTSVLPRVRSEAFLYDKADTAIARLTGAWYFRPGTNLYGRVTAGLLEPMFGGISAEMLWYPQGGRFALGAELAHVAQRDYDQAFDFLDYQVTTGHLTAYWDMGRGYQAQLDVGRYLAGDWGTTLSIDRRFENGWSVGAFATLTDVPFEDFGEGSFDKGIRLTIPLGWVSGQATRDDSGLTIRPVLRDGGARLDVDGRLYEVIRGANGAELSDGWGRFWR